MALITRDDIAVEMRLEEEEIYTLKDQLDAMCYFAQSAFDELSNRTMEQQQHTEYHTIDSNKVKSIFLQNCPVKEITSIYHDPDWEYTSDDEIESSDYHVNTKSGIVTYDGFFDKGVDSVRVIYTAGYKAFGSTLDTGETALPYVVKQAMVRQACHWFDDGKNKQWAVNSVRSPDDNFSTITFNRLKNNYLPDFVMMAERFNL